MRLSWLEIASLGLFAYIICQAGLHFGCIWKDFIGDPFSNIPYCTGALPSTCTTKEER